jgi:hypothetical protein
MLVIAKNSMAPEQLQLRKPVNIHYKKSRYPLAVQ